MQVGHKKLGKLLIIKSVGKLIKAGLPLVMAFKPPVNSFSTTIFEVATSAFTNGKLLFSLFLNNNSSLGHLFLRPVQSFQEWARNRFHIDR